jgi:hypothetical protein
VQLDSEDLLARMRQDWPTEYELTRLRALVDAQEAEIQRLTALAPSSTFAATAPRPYSLSDEEGRHG